MCRNGSCLGTLVYESVVIRNQPVYFTIVGQNHLQPFFFYIFVQYFENKSYAVEMSTIFQGYRMRKIIIGLLVIGLLLATVIPVGSTVLGRTVHTESIAYPSQVLGSECVRIYVSLCEIKGFVLFGHPDDQILLFQNPLSSTSTLTLGNESNMERR